MLVEAQQILIAMARADNLKQGKGTASHGTFSFSGINIYSWNFQASLNSSVIDCRRTCVICVEKLSPLWTVYKLKSALRLITCDESILNLFIGEPVL